MNLKAKITGNLFYMIQLNVLKRNRTSLHIAAKTGNFEFVRILIEHGADINPVDKK